MFVSAVWTFFPGFGPTNVDATAAQSNFANRTIHSNIRTTFRSRSLDITHDESLYHLKPAFCRRCELYGDKLTSGIRRFQSFPSSSRSITFMHSRRQFLKTSAAVAAGSLLHHTSLRASIAT